jgi:hypothetical protein
MREVSERLEGILEEYDSEYQNVKEEYDELSEEIDEKIEEHYEKWHEINKLQERQAEIEENEIDPFISEAYNKKIEGKIYALAEYSQEEAQERRDEFQRIKEEEGKEDRKKVVYQEQDFPYYPPDPSIESRKNSLHAAVERSIKDYQDGSNEVDEEVREEMDESEEVDGDIREETDESDDDT